MRVQLPQLVPRYELLGMKDLFIDFAGMKKENYPTGRAIRALTTGSRLTISRDKDLLHLLNHDGIPVARLSKTAQTRWQNRTESIREIQVLALAHRCRTDIKDPEFQNRCQCDNWEVPVVELRYLQEE